MINDTEFLHTIMDACRAEFQLVAMSIYIHVNKDILRNIE